MVGTAASAGQPREAPEVYRRRPARLRRWRRGDARGRERRAAGTVARAQPTGQQQPAEADRDGDDEARRPGRPPARRSTRTLAATIAPVSPVPSAVPSESVSDSALVAAPWRLGRRLAQDDERERRVGEPHPEAGHAERGDRRPATGRPGRRTRSIPASPMMVTANPTRTKLPGRPAASRRGPGSRHRRSRRSWPRSARSRPRSPTGRASRRASARRTRRRRRRRRSGCRAAGPPPAGPGARGASRAASGAGARGPR